MNRLNALLLAYEFLGLHGILTIGDRLKVFGLEVASITTLSPQMHIFRKRVHEVLRATRQECPNLSAAFDFCPHGSTEIFGVRLGWKF